MVWGKVVFTEATGRPLKFAGRGLIRPAPFEERKKSSSVAHPGTWRERRIRTREKGAAGYKRGKLFLIHGRLLFLTGVFFTDLAGKVEKRTQANRLHS